MSIIFDRAADFYDETRGFPAGVEQDAAALYVRAGELTATSQIIEPGIGTGRIALPVAAKTQARIIGVDLSAKMMARLRAKRTTERVSVALADATQLPFENDSFDRAIASHIFHLIPNWQHALSELERVLEPGGVLLHSWTEHDDHPLRTIWRESLTNSRSGSAYNTFRGTDFLIEGGWTEARPRCSLNYARRQSPVGMIGELRGRVWSSLWHVPEADIERGVRAIEQYAAANGLAMNQPIGFTTTLYITVFAPPAR